MATQHHKTLYMEESRAIGDLT